MPLLQLLRPTLPILIGASLMLTLSMGLRQSLGIFMQPLTHDIGISVSDFTLAIAIQNLAWGFLQPIAGAMTARFGFRIIMMAGAVFYIAGLSLMASAHGFVSVLLGGGVLIGMSLACTAAAIAMSVAARAVPATVRSTVMGMVSGSGIARRVVVGAARADPQRRLWLAGRARRFRHFVGGADSRRPGSPAASTGFRCPSRRRTTSATPRPALRSRSRSATPHSW